MSTDDLTKMKVGVTVVVSIVITALGAGATWGTVKSAVSDVESHNTRITVVEQISKANTQAIDFARERNIIVESEREKRDEGIDRRLERIERLLDDRLPAKR